MGFKLQESASNGKNWVIFKWPVAMFGEVSNLLLAFFHEKHPKAQFCTAVEHLQGVRSSLALLSWVAAVGITGQVTACSQGTWLGA